MRPGNFPVLFPLRSENPTSNFDVTVYFECKFGGKSGCPFQPNQDDRKTNVRIRGHCLINSIK